MKKLFFTVCLFTAAATLMMAQEQSGPNASAANEKAAIPDGVELLQTAGQLVQYGYATENPLPLIQAVEIYQTYVSPSDKAVAEKAKTTTVDDATAPTNEKVSNKSYDIKTLLADAKRFSDGDEHYDALIDNLSTSATRGATRNYDAHTDLVRAHSTDTYTVTFRGDELACVVVSGDGDTDLDLYIYDSNGNLIASDTDRTDTCVCSWTPKWTGSFTIKIKNLGSVSNCYVMAVN